MPKLAKSTVENMTLRELIRLKGRLESERAIHGINGERTQRTSQNLRIVNNELAVRKQNSEVNSTLRK